MAAVRRSCTGSRHSARAQASASSRPRPERERAASVTTARTPGTVTFQNACNRVAPSVAADS